MSRVHSWLLTINNWTEDVYNAVFALEKKCSYICVGKEIGLKKKTPHLHVYMYFTVPITQKRMKKYFPTARLDITKGSPQQIRTYVIKQNDYKEVGTLPKQGNRSDLESLKDAVKLGATKDLLMETHSEVVAKYPRFVQEYCDLHACDKLEKETLDTPYQWQAELLEYIKQKPDNRKIKWYYDADGGHGKTHMARYLADHYNAFFTNGGKAVDIAYNYNCQPIVIFDYCRDNEEFVSYGAIEAIKNGILTSNKYNSKTKRFQPPHVIVFANFKPAPGKFSKDRVDLTEL